MRLKSTVLHFLVFAAITLASAGCKRPAAPPAPAPGRALVRIAAAADLKFALDAIIAQFKTDHPDIEISPTYGSSGNFFAQISNGAPFDLFLSADINYAKKLADQGMGDKEGVFNYARGRIVIWVPNQSKLDLEKLGMRALVDPSVKHISIGNPDHAPYGRAAVAAMKSLGLYDEAQNRLVMGENIAAAAQFVQSGSADIGIIAQSIALAPSFRRQGRYWTIPADTYPPIEQGGIVLSSAGNIDAARAFKAFLISPSGKAVLKQFGFDG